VAEEPLDRMQVSASFQQVGGEDMAQGMDAAPLADPRLELGRIVELLRGGGVHRALPIPGREQPFGGPVLAPVGPQLRQQAGGEERVAVLGPLRLLNA
jgi:hypothetical protein